MKKIYYLIALFTLIYFNSEAQLWSAEYSGTSNAGLSNPFTGGTVTIDPNIMVSGIGHGTGLTGQSGNDYYITNGFTSAFNANNYYEFKMTVNTGYKINFTKFKIGSYLESNGPNVFAIRSSLDNFAADIVPVLSIFTVGVGIAPFNDYLYLAVDLTGAAFQNVTGTIAFRVYGYGGSSTTAKDGVSAFVFGGTTALPVSFGNMSAKQSDGQLKINWATLTETNNSHFDIEVSKDGNSFTKIATVKSKALAGTSEISQNYEYQIPVNQIAGFMSLPFILGLLSFAIARRRKILAGVMVIFLIGAAISCTKGDVSMSTSAKSVYVRIAQVDIDGKKSYSKVIQAVNE